MEKWEIVLLDLFLSLLNILMVTLLAWLCFRWRSSVNFCFVSGGKEKSGIVKCLPKDNVNLP